MARILALDFGQVRIGVAISDPERRMAFGRPTLQRRNDADDLRRLRELVQAEEDIERIVVGYPRTLSGKAGPAAESVERFVARLRGAFPALTVETWDERMTTAQSERMLIGAGMRREKRRKVVDESAAMLILQSWLDARRGEN